MESHIIKTDEELSEALRRAREPAESSPAPGSSAADELRLLSLVIGDYDDERYPPMESASPVEVIRFVMEQNNLSVKDISPCFGGMPHACEVLSGKRGLSLAMIRKLYERHGIPVGALVEKDDSSRCNGRQKPALS